MPPLITPDEALSLGELIDHAEIEALAQKIVAQYAQSDWSTRAQMLIFYVQQGVPTYGNAGD